MLRTTISLRILVSLTFLGFQLVAFGQNQAPVLVKKLNPDFSSYPFGFTNFNGSLYFFASRDQIRTDNISLWKSDGTEDGTMMVKDSVGFKTMGELPEIKVLNNQMFFLTNNYSPDSAFLHLWRSDGTESGTQVLKKCGRDFSGGSDNATGQLTLFNNKLYFNFYDASGGSEPFFTDGTVGGTQMLKDIQLTPYGFNGSPSFPHRFTVVGNSLYFWAIPFSNGLKTTLYKSDGTTANTVAVKEFANDLSSTTFLSHLIPYNGKVYFSAKANASSGYELWSSDGTEGGTALVKEINPGTTNSGDGVSRIFQAQVFKNRLYFWAFDPATGHEMWSTDGTPAGTSLLKNTHSSAIPSLNQQKYSSNPFFVFGGKMYYANNDGLKGREPWVTDGTVAGTKLFLDVNVGTFGSSSIWNPGFSIFEGKMYFRASDGTGVQICLADTANSTFTKFPVTSGFFSAELPYDLNLTDDESFVFHAFNGQLFFQGGFHPTNGDPFAFSHDFFKLAPLTSVSLTETETYHFRISPNPSNGRFWIQSSSQPSEEIYIQVLNMLGKTIWEGQPNMGINQFEVDLSNQPAGVYSLQIFGSSFKGENRLLKQ